MYLLKYPTLYLIKLNLNPTKRFQHKHSSEEV